MKSGRISSKSPDQLDYGSSGDSTTNLFGEIGKDIVPLGSGINFESFIELRRKNYLC